MYIPSECWLRIAKYSIKTWTTIAGTYLLNCRYLYLRCCVSCAKLHVHMCVCVFWSQQSTVPALSTWCVVDGRISRSSSHTCLDELLHKARATMVYYFPAVVRELCSMPVCYAGVSYCAEPHWPILHVYTHSLLPGWYYMCILQALEILRVQPNLYCCFSISQRDYNGTSLIRHHWPEESVLIRGVSFFCGVEMYTNTVLAWWEKMCPV